MPGCATLFPRLAGGAIVTRAVDGASFPLGLRHFRPRQARSRDPSTLRVRAHSPLLSSRHRAPPFNRASIAWTGTSRRAPTLTVVSFPLVSNRYRVDLESPHVRAASLIERARRSWFSVLFGI